MINCNFNVPAHLSYYPYQIPNVSTSMQDYLYDFLNLPGNPVSNADIIKHFEDDNTFAEDDIQDFVKFHSYDFNVRPITVFAETSNPDSCGEIGIEKIGSYSDKSYMIGLPKCSGQSEYEKDVLNNYWVSTGSDDARNPSENKEIAQVSDDVQDSENDGNELDVMITQNKNVYRLLRSHGPKAARLSIIVANELNYIFPKAGFFVQTLLEKCPDKIYPIVLRKLRERYISLFIQKINKVPQITKVLESQLPTLRSQYVKPPKVGPQLNPIWISTIEYDQRYISFYAKFIEDAMNYEHKYNDNIKASIDKMISQLRTPNHYKLSYYHAISLLLLAYFMNEIQQLHILDNIDNKSISIAVEIGVTKKNLHGIQKILSVISRMFSGQRKSELTQHLAGLMDVVDTHEAARIASIGFLLVKTIYNFTSESGPVPFVELMVEGNTISLVPINQNETSIDISDTKSNKLAKWQ
ncbi:hypothetical protein GPJ56_003422 [Histomonas meleagridis]|uniref:uncharacterized protein n=1 Tax=Histomonas meleagridis TaxID=135588 RepID=UPI0035599A7A|nr:hypothetical protein GPJ56_003422 [Histomonas meleagridis]KAH0799114.1 hypothetical protein GO595_007911 [Histomonas meleagridis]